MTLLSSVQGGVCNLPVPQVRSHLCSVKCQSYVSQDSNGVMDPLMEKKKYRTSGNGVAELARGKGLPHGPGNSIKAPSV